MFTKKEHLILSFLLILSAATALKLLHIDYMVNYSPEPYKSFCNINAEFNCDLVASSEYSSLWGVPIAFFGLSGDLLLLLFLFVGNKLASVRAALPTLYFLTFLFKTIGCLTLAAISFFFISSHCVLCMLYWLLTLVGFIFLGRIQSRTGFEVTRLFKTSVEALWSTKWFTLLCLIIFVSSSLYTRHFLYKCGCKLRDPQSLQCHNYELTTNTPFLGTAAAKLEIFTYTDFECPWCSRAHLAIAALVNKYEKQVRLIRRDFPLDVQCNPSLSRPFHVLACQAAYFARCAGKQGKYWEYHNELYQAQRALSPETFLNIAKLLNLDLEEIESCVRSPEIHAAVSADIQEAIDYGIQATPTFRIFGELFTGALTEESLNDYLKHYPAITATTLQRAFRSNFDKNIQIVDIRKKADFERDHIPGAVWISAQSLERTLRNLQPEKPVLLYDQDGTQSLAAYDLLIRNGFDSVHILKGGYQTWPLQ
ncbi:MAG: thioredoxin domain-containing protein [Deltaproteobacteria bacterium]|nr:thioredoxin domain-containing protein [Deltaproteobacteria bacterium]